MPTSKPKKNMKKTENPNTRYRCYSIMQYKGRPFEDYEEDRITLKPDVTPLITEEQIIKALGHHTIESWAWVWHDKDVYTKDDEEKDEKHRVKAGERKFCHAHIVIKLSTALTIKNIANWFGVLPSRVRPLHGRNALIDAVDYLPHEALSAVAEDKYHYPDEEIHANFDFRKRLDELHHIRQEYGEDAKNMPPAQMMQQHVLREGWSIKQCIEYDSQAYAKVHDKLPKLRSDYLYTLPPAPFRMSIYITGPGGSGKGVLSEHLARRLVTDLHKPTQDGNTEGLAMQTGYDEENPIFRVGNDERVNFDRYDGEPVLIWDDFRGTDFIKRFHIGGTFNILDSHPKRQAQQAKGTHVILINAFNVINSTQDYEEFIKNISGDYTDRNGKKHEGEDVRQAYRRIPLVIRLREDDFDILLRKDIADGESSESTEYVLYATVDGSIREIARELSGNLKEEALKLVSEPIIAACQKIVDMQFSQDSNIEKLPEKFLRLGRIKGGMMSMDGAKSEDNSKES